MPIPDDFSFGQFVCIHASKYLFALSFGPGSTVLAHAAAPADMTI
jgi:hypothetical protein